jgi:hypothetical protein
VLPEVAAAEIEADAVAEEQAARGGSSQTQPFLKAPSGTSDS